MSSPVNEATFSFLFDFITGSAFKVLEIKYLGKKGEFLKLTIIVLLYSLSLSGSYINIECLPGLQKFEKIKLDFKSRGYPFFLTSYLGKSPITIAS